MDTQKKTKKLNSIIWTCAIILIFLFLLTTLVVVMRIGDFIPNEWNVIFLVPKEPSFVMSDGQKVWETDTEIELFRSEYKNDKGDIVVESANGESVFAPGSQIDYTFSLKNNGNMAIDYGVQLDFGFLKDLEHFDMEHCPLLVRLYKADHADYIVGSDDTWVPVNELGVYDDKGTLGVNSYNNYTLEIKWEFEGDDATDTWLGNLTAEETVTFVLDINTKAEQSPDPEATGGILSTDDDMAVKKIGGNINIIPFIILITLLIASATGFIIALIIKNKGKNKE